MSQFNDWSQLICRNCTMSSNVKLQGAKGSSTGSSEVTSLKEWQLWLRELSHIAWKALHIVSCPTIVQLFHHKKDINVTRTKQEDFFLSFFLSFYIYMYMCMYGVKCGQSWVVEKGAQHSRLSLWESICALPGLQERISNFRQI